MDQDFGNKEEISRPAINEIQAKNTLKRYAKNRLGSKTLLSGGVAPKKPAISSPTFFLMLGTALLFDFVGGGVNLIPVIGQVLSSCVSAVAWLTFFIWYKIKGINFANPKKALAAFGLPVIEIIPILNVLPVWTAEVVVMYSLQKAEEKGLA